jgi:hypothetical protein
MVGSFKQFVSNEDKTAYFTFGRMNPPTVGHGKLLDKLAMVSSKKSYFVYLSQSQNPKKNPLDYSSKVKFARKMFPKHARSIMINKKVKTAIDVLVAIYQQGFKNIVMVVGSDRIHEFDALLNRYNGKKARHGFYNFESIKVVSAGERDPDSEGVKGMSASKMRDFATENDFASFSFGLPKEMNNKEARNLFVAVRKGMGIKEETKFKNHVALEPVSETRENYVKGKLFGLGDTVRIKETQEQVKVSWLGSNYLVVEMKDGSTKRLWLDGVEKMKEAKQMGARNPVAKNAPKYNKAATFIDRKLRNKKGYRKHKRSIMDQVDPVDRAQQKIDKEKDADAIKHDKAMDRARLKSIRIKNAKKPGDLKNV